MHHTIKFCKKKPQGLYFLKPNSTLRSLYSKGTNTRGSGFFAFEFGRLPSSTLAPKILLLSWGPGGGGGGGGQAASKVVLCERVKMQIMQ